MLPFSFFRGRGAQCFVLHSRPLGRGRARETLFLRRAAPPRSRRARPHSAARQSFSTALPACSPRAALAACRDMGRKGRNAVFSEPPPTKFRLHGNSYGDSRCLPAVRRALPHAAPVCNPPRAEVFSRAPPAIRPRAARHILPCAEVFPPRPRPRRQSFVLHKAEKPCPSFRETVDSSGEFSSICGHISY